MENEVKEAKQKAKKPDIVSDIQEVAEKHGATVGVTSRADGSKTITIVCE